jgi:hypothetical protein
MSGETLRRELKFALVHVFLAWHLILFTGLGSFALTLLSAFELQFCRAFHRETRRLNQYASPWTSCIGAAHSLC